MNRQVMRLVASVNIVAGCILLQGCGTSGKKTEEPVTVLPEQPVVVIPPVAPIAPVEIEEPVFVPSTTAYTIQKGDTISGIAYKYNLRWQDVMAINTGINPKQMRVGQVLQLPGQVDLSKARARSAATAAKVTAPKVKSAVSATNAKANYVVKAGDSLSVIAHKHGVKTAALREANGLTSDRINVGQKLFVPGAKAGGADSVKSAKSTTTTAPKIEAPVPVETPVTDMTSVGTTGNTALVESPVVKSEVAPVPALSANVQTYVVKEGEDLYQVAIRWGVSPSDLKTLNNLTDYNLKAGTELKIPGGAQ